jgi:hypothetical protein
MKQPATQELAMTHQQQKRQTYVVVVASLAAAKAAQTLREEDFTGRLVIIGDEADDEAIAPCRTSSAARCPVDRHRLSDPAVPLRDSVGCNAG